MYDLIIIGAGPAGLAAAVYAARQKIKFAVIAKKIGGQTAMSSDVENYLGFHLVSGAELISKFQEHLKDYDIELKTSEVTSLEKNGDNFIVRTQEESFETKSVLVTSGKEPRKLSVPGEKEFTSKGVTYCATCDAPLFGGKDVAVIGGGNAAMDAALLGEKYSNKVHIININSEFRGEEEMKKRISQSQKITVYNDSKTTQINGDKFVSGVKFEKDGQTKEIPVQGVFIEIGSIPSVDFDKITEKNDYNEIKIHDEGYLSNVTSVKGVFAAGDVSDVPEKQIIVAGGEGVKAVLGIFKYLQKRA